MHHLITFSMMMIKIAQGLHLRTDLHLGLFHLKILHAHCLREIRLIPLKMAVIIGVNMLIQS
nr:MAG TPA: hypothetical protein [Caudoviricetes sp.]